MKPIAVSILGRPGSGKDVQAGILAKEYNLIRISTSELLKERLYRGINSPQIKKEREIFESGLLNTPSWVLEVIKEHIMNLSNNNFNNKNGIIFSGSPRTVYESENLIPFIQKIVGKDNMFPIYLDILEKEGIKRIIKRNKKHPRALDGSKEKLKIRTKEFEERTWPAIQYFDSHGIKLIKVDGSKSIDEVAKKIEIIVKNNLNE